MKYIKHKVECPICEGKAFLKFEQKSVPFRKENFQIYSHFYKCEKCNEEFTTTEIDNLNITQVYNQYRERHNIPTSEQIKLIRKRYNISAVKMSLILGIGQNQYGLYESGEIPNESNSQLISLITNPKVFKEHLLKRKSILQPKEFEKILHKIELAISDYDESSYSLTNRYFDPFISPSEFTGFKFASFKKFANMILFFLNDAFLVTRLNKYLFYADFLNYKSTGYSISGYNYAAIPLGPVPQDYKTIYNIVEENNFITTETYDYGIDFTEKFTLLKNFDSSIFTENELNTLQKVKVKFANLKTKEIIEMSHKEIGWKENVESKNLISYQKYAFRLKGF